MPVQPLPRHRPPQRALDPRDRFGGRRRAGKQFIGPHAIQLAASLIESAVPVEKRAYLFGSTRVRGETAQRDAVLAQRAARASRGAGRAGRIEHVRARAARVDRLLPQLQFVGRPQHSRGGRVGQLPRGVRVLEPTGEIAYSRRRPHVTSGREVGAFDRIEQRRREFRVRRQHRSARRDGRHQAAPIAFRA